MALWFYEKQHPDHPWLAQTAIIVLSSWLKPTDVGFEWGAGRSTIWLARKVHHLTSVEHDMKWYQVVKEELEKARITNVNLVLCKIDGGKESEYVRAMDSYPPNSLDFVLIDGRLRHHCLDTAIDKLRPGGLVILDNANRYFPSDSRSPGSVRVYPRKEWQDSADRLGKWRLIWTSNGVSDTVLWIKP